MEEDMIILIEDDPDHAEIIMEILENKRKVRDVVLVRDGADAIDYFQELDLEWSGQINNKIKLIVLDLNLPKICGMDVLKYLKRNPKYNRIPVVILSTSTNRKTIDEAYENGVDDFITKPVSYDEFITKLEGLRRFF